MTSVPAYVVLAEGALGMHSSKTAVCLLRHRPREVVAVIDSQYAGRTTQEVMGLGGDVPVVGRLEEALGLGPNRLLVGVNPPGGRLPEQWQGVLLEALRAGLDIYSGMHVFLRDDPALAAAARSAGAKLVDLRSVPDDLDVPRGARAQVDAPVVLTVGSDCNVGKMTASWQLVEWAAARGCNYRFVATGQTGVLLAGKGMAVDRVVADFLAGAAERLLAENAQGADLILVEGQGSLIHPFFSGVTLGLLHGCQPDGMILCHAAGRTHMRHLDGDAIPPLSRLVSIYEEAAGWRRSAPVLGIALATHALEEGAAREALRQAEAETGLPSEDPVRFPTGALFEGCEALRRAQR